ncbi:hypothetical protein FBR04_14525 [Betaproteobacteria bacterium PRO7]|jgi:hypothetical protein|nr:hypothetical protein [Betaproteobacteria bacterium PRO7]
MRFGPIRAVVIDDKPTHLFAIGAGLAGVGIPCMSYWYNRGKGSLVPPPQEPHRYLRLVFMDLNLAELGGNPEPETLEAAIEDVLKQIIASDAGPYVLVFWTEVTGKAAQVGNLLYERLKDIPLPLAITELKKAPFLPKRRAKGEDVEVALQKMFADLSRKLRELGKEITRLSGVREELNIVAEWESRATEAAAGAINEVVSHARKDAADEKLVGDTLKNLLAFVGIAAAGREPAAAEPARALDLGMGEILIDRFSTSVDERTYRKLVSSVLGPVIAAAPAFKDRHRVAAALNTFFHVDVNCKGAKSNERGVVIPIGRHLPKSKIGLTHTELLQKEYLYPAKQNKDSPVLYAALPAEARAVLVEVGADCDHAQPKPRSIRYLVGFEVPKKYKDFLVRNGKTQSPSLHCLGPWLIGGKEIYLIVSTRRFITWQHSRPPAGKVEYRLRTALVNKLLHDYSNWHSRPGIVEFRPS